MTNFSNTKCTNSSCDSTTFEIVDDQPLGANYSKKYLRCSKCKTFLAWTFKNNTNVLLERLQSDIDDIKRHLGI